MSEGEKLKQRLKQLLALPQNRVCCDCSMVGPTWASKNLGVFVCLDCAGVHRSMGTHISQVRSVDLDSWTPAWVAVMESVGNALGNSCWEARMPPGKKISPSVSKDARSAFIRDKYAKKAYYSPPSETGATAAPVLSAAEQRKQMRLARLNANNNANNTNVNSNVIPVTSVMPQVIVPVTSQQPRQQQQQQQFAVPTPVSTSSPLSLDLFSGMTVKTSQTPSNNSNGNTFNLFEGMSVSPSTPAPISPSPSSSSLSTSNNSNNNFDLLNMDGIVVQECSYVQPVTAHVRQEDPFAEFITL